MRSGSYVEVACAAAGVSRRTFNAWLLRGRSTDARNAPYRALREQVERARAEAETRHVAQIARATAESWQAAAWLLERQYPERWGRPSQRPKASTEPAAPPVEPDDPFGEVDELALARARRDGTES